MSQPPSHLPPGVARGRQHRGHAVLGKVVGVLFPLIGVGFLVGFVAIAVAIGEPVFALAGIGGGAAFIGAGVAFFRSANPRAAKHLELTLDRLQVRRGERIDARLRLTDPGRVRDRIEVGIVCEVSYDLWERSGTDNERSRRTNRATAFEHWMPASTTQPVQTISLEVPRGVPFSHEGRCLSYAWRVVAREPVSLRFDPSRRIDIWVAP